MSFAITARRHIVDPRRFALLTVVAFAVTTVGLLAAPSPASAWGSNEFSSSSEKQLAALTNQSRASAGLKALKVDGTLTAIARGRSKDMIVRDYFSHNIPPSGKTVFSILDAKGYCYAIAGENIGWNDYPDDVATRTVHRMFMDSSGHRSNVMGKKWDVIGVGAFKGPTGKKMWTVIFADKCGSSGGGGGSGSSGGGGGGGTTKTKPKPTPKPTPNPTPTPTPTPYRTMPPEPTDPSGIGPGGDNEFAPPTATPWTVPPGEPAPTGEVATGLRVVDPSTPPGLVETIVGDVTGFYLGS